MADDLEAFRILRRDDRERGVVLDRIEVSTSLPSTLPASGGLRQARADVGGDLRDGDGFGIGALAAVGQSDDRHSGRLTQGHVGRRMELALH